MQVLLLVATITTTAAAQNSVTDSMLLNKAKYQHGQLDSTNFVNLILTTKKYYTENYAPPATTGMYELLEAFLKKYATGEKSDTNISNLVVKVYSENDYIRSFSKPLTLCYIINNYDASRDTALLLFDAISRSLDDLHTRQSNYEYDLQEKKLQATIPAYHNKITSAAEIGVVPEYAMEIDSVMQLHSNFVRGTNNLLLLDEGCKLLKDQNDFYHQFLPFAKYNFANTPHINLMPLASWFFDTVLHVNKGVQPTETMLGKMGADLPATQFAYLVEKHNGSFSNFKAFKERFLKKLGALLNDASRAIFKNDSLNLQLPQLLLWSKASLEIEPSNIYYLDTYAHLLYAKGDKKTAIENETKAIGLLRTGRGSAGPKWLLTQMEKTLNKMKLGQQITRKDEEERQWTDL